MATFDANNNIVKETSTEIKTRIKNLLLSYYPDLSFSATSFESLWVESFLQMSLDLQDYMLILLNQLSLTSASGSFLDHIGYIRGVFRKAGSYTLQNIDITTSGVATIYGVDATDKIPFRISDSSGNNYILLNTQYIVSAGTYQAQFRSEKMDSIVSSINSINTILENTLNVISVNNSTTYSSLGSIIESDPIYRARIEASNFTNQLGLLQTIRNQLLTFTSINSVNYYQNTSDQTVSGIPSGRINFIIDGGSDNEIGSVFANNALTIATYGSRAISYVDSNGKAYIYYVDSPQVINFYTTMNITLFNILSFDSTLIKNYIISNFPIIVGGNLTITTIQDLVKQYFTNNAITGIVDNVQVSSDNITFAKYISASSPSNLFTPVLANISITLTYA